MAHPPGRSILMVAGGADPVGTGRQMELAAAALAAAGWGVHLGVTTRGGAVPGRLAAAGHAVHRVGSRPVPDAAAALRLVATIRTVKPQVVVAWGRRHARLAALAASVVRARGPRCRLIAIVAAHPRGLADACALARADRVIATSAAIATACRRTGIDAARIVVIEPAADPAPATALSRTDVAARLGLDPAKRWTVCLAPLVASSRLDRLLWAIDQLGVVHRGIEHVLVGSGPLAHHVRRRSRVQHLAERLCVVPECDCLPELLRESRLIWQSGEVAYGGALFDALGLGKPTVAVESDAARQAIADGVTGWVVPPLPESEFPRRALSLIEDDALAERFGAAALGRAAAVFAREPFTARLLDVV